MMTGPRLQRAMTAAAIALAATTVAAAEPRAAEQRLRDELRVLLLDLAQSGAFGATAPERVELVLEEPARHVANLGVLVDSTGAEQARDGLHVLGTTPGGSAERMGLRTGDVITAVNGTVLAGLGGHSGGGALAAVRLREAVDALGEGAELVFEVRRGERDLRLHGPVARSRLPAFRLVLGDPATPTPTPTQAADEGCGRISIVDVAPRQQGLHAVTLNRIDGRSAGIGEQTSFRLPAGEHVLELGEHIESRYLGFNDRLRNQQPRYKSLVVHVEAGTTHFVAARLHPERRTEWVDGAYWDPLVWRVAAEPCP